MKILFVVHRYVPYAGGSEYYVRDMAEEMLRRGYDVTVLAHEHQGDQNGVKVSNAYQDILVNQKWDMIFVHGGDVISQDMIHQNAEFLKIHNQPVCYMLIKPSESPTCLLGLKTHPIIAYSAKPDIDFIKFHRVEYKARRIRHGIPFHSTWMTSNTVEPSKSNYFISAGGFWPHKAMTPLVEAWERSDIDAELHLYGYGSYETRPKTSDPRIFQFGNQSLEDVHYAIRKSKGYIMNSYEEGYGLVLLEAMKLYVPWYARRGAGAADELSRFGKLYDNEKELLDLLKNQEVNYTRLFDAYDFVKTNHSIEQTGNDLEDIINEYHRGSLHFQPKQPEPIRMYSIT